MFSLLLLNFIGTIFCSSVIHVENRTPYTIAKLSLTYNTNNPLTNTQTITKYNLPPGISWNPTNDGCGVFYSLKAGVPTLGGTNNFVSLIPSNSDITSDCGLYTKLNYVRINNRSGQNLNFYLSQKTIKNFINKIVNFGYLNCDNNGDILMFYLIHDNPIILKADTIDGKINTILTLTNDLNNNVITVKPDLIYELSDPTSAPTQSPTNAPTQAPTNAPTQSPTSAPTQAPTIPSGCDFWSGGCFSFAPIVR